MKYAFLVNKSEKNVMQKIYFNDEMRGSLLHENCQIFNDSNWDCSTETKLEKEVYEKKIKMIDGVFSYETSLIENKTLIDMSKDEKGFCAK